MFMPALAIFLSVWVVSHAGPIVQMIFVCRKARRSGIGLLCDSVGNGLCGASRPRIAQRESPVASGAERVARIPVVPESKGTGRGDLRAGHRGLVDCFPVERDPHGLVIGKVPSVRSYETAIDVE